MIKRVADILFEVLSQEGITDCFMVVGGSAMYLDNALANNQSITKYCNHHEQACAMAAEAYARYSGRMAAVCVTSGPGATNTLTGVLGAWQDSLPMFVVSGNVRQGVSMASATVPLRYRGLQEFDIINSVRNMTKYALTITDPRSIRRETLKAVAIAMSGRRGPVWLDIPQDIQSTLIDENELLPDEDPIIDTAVNDETLVKMLSLLTRAERPCVLLGSGIITSHLQAQFEEFAECFRLPVVGGAWNGDVFYNEHPRFYGLSGSVGPRVGNFILYNSDLILVLGNSLSYKQTGYDVQGFAPKSRIIMVDVDKNEYLKLGNKVDLFIHGSLESFFRTCLKSAHVIQASNEWLDFCDELYDKFSAYEGASGVKPDERVNKYYFWQKFNEYAPPDTLLVLGNSQVALAANQVGKNHREQRFIANYICGSMGYDIPASIGAGVASGKQVVCVTGDGSIMMNLQELQTIRHYKIPCKIILFNNDGYGALRQTFKNFFDGVEIGCSPMSGVGFPNFSKIAHAFDFSYRRCRSNGEICDCLEWLFANENSLICEIAEILDDPVVPKLMSKATADGKMVTSELYELSPFLSAEELDAAMCYFNRDQKVF